MAADQSGALRALRANLWPTGAGAGVKSRLAVLLVMSLISSALAAIAPLFLRGLIASSRRPRSSRPRSRWRSPFRQRASSGWRSSRRG